MKKSLVALIAALGLSANPLFAIAGLVDIEVGAGTWNPTLSGDIAYGATGTDIDLKDDLDLEADSNSYMYLRFDHFIPIVPNLRVEMQNYSASGSGAVTGQFGDLTLTGATETDITLNQQDIILYWGIPGLNALTLGILDLEVGLDIKQIEGEVTLTTATGTETADFNTPIPLGYAAVLVDIPVIPVGLEVSVKQLGSVVNESKAKVDVTLPLPIPLLEIALEAGVKQQTIEITDDLVDNLNVTIENSGMFFGANVKF
jgi:outer membrane protein